MSTFPSWEGPAKSSLRECLISSLDLPAVGSFRVEIQWLPRASIGAIDCARHVRSWTVILMEIRPNFERMAHETACCRVATTSETVGQRARVLGCRPARAFRMTAMLAPPSPRWYRLVRWLPGGCSAVALALAAATLRPSEQNVLLAAAILCALPWALALLAMDLGQGFADRAALIVCAGLLVNTVLLWWFVAVLRARLLERSRAASRSHR